MPPDVHSAGGRPIRIEDVDRAVKLWFDKDVDANVDDQRGAPRKVPIIFSSGERWVASSDERGIRDRDGRLILPVISIHRMSIDPINNMSALGANVPRMQISRLVAPKSADLSNADKMRAISTRRLNASAVYEITTIPFPFTGLARYEVVLQAQYIHQVNSIVEKMMAQLEYYDVPNFVMKIDGDGRREAVPDGIGQSELQSERTVAFDDRIPITGPYVVGYFDGDFGDSGNLQEFTDQERIVEMKFNFKVPVVLQLDPDGNEPAVQKQLTAFSVSLGDEQVCFVDDEEELDLIFGPD